VSDLDWPIEPGSAQDRTAMAWVRTALSLVGVAALVARYSGSVAVAVLVLGVAAVAAAWLIVHVERRHPARATSMAAGEDVAAPVPVLGITAVSLTLALVALVLVVI
jgi:uncharacterized membrane protein YidH (DUF202 family)